jgi:hypothetical protein
LNRYSFENNNPVNNIEKNGHQVGNVQGIAMTLAVCLIIVIIGSEFIMPLYEQRKTADQNKLSIDLIIQQEKLQQEYQNNNKYSDLPRPSDSETAQQGTTVPEKYVTIFPVPPKQDNTNLVQEANVQDKTPVQPKNPSDSSSTTSGSDNDYHVYIEYINGNVYFTLQPILMGSSTKSHSTENGRSRNSKQPSFTEKRSGYGVTWGPRKSNN